MNIKRKCQLQRLSEMPLALVLIQIRFSPVADLDGYIPQIQSALRKNGYPLIGNNDNLSVSVTPSGISQVHTRQWSFSSADRYANIILDSNHITFQTTDYNVFEEFYERFVSICTCVFGGITDFSRANVIMRIGLRYVDRIIPMNAEDSIDSYIADGFRISQAPVFGGQPKVCTISQAGEAEIATGGKGMLVVHISQGEKGLFLPPDLMANPPRMKTDIPEDALIGMIDTDHSYVPVSSLAYEENELKMLFYGMHDNVIELFHSVVSEGGRRKWK